jgi:hypothetical protein
MRTTKQQEAARENGAQSNGPVTEEGKAISARNNTRHGLLSKTVALVGESDEKFADLFERLIAEHRPATDTEMEVVHTLGMALWRRARIWSAEKATLDKHMLRQESGDGPNRLARAMETAAGSLVTISRQEAAFNRQFAACLRHLDYLKSHRNPDADGPSLNEITQAGVTWAPGPFPAKS